jgi:protein-disulfide isomerase
MTGLDPSRGEPVQPYPYNYDPYNPPPPWGPPPPKKSNAGLIIGLVVGLFVLFVVVVGGIAGALLFVRAKASAPVATAEKAFWSDGASPVPVTSQDPMRGERDALVTIVLFSDFQCPFCARLETTLDSVRAKYGRDVRIIWKNEPLPFHPNARPAAEAAEGVFELRGNDAFWRFHDTCFANQARLSTSSYEEWARREGVEGTTFSNGLASHRFRAKVDMDDALAKQLGVNGTPLTFVNGIKISGAQPLSVFEKTIDDEIVKAERAIAAGTPRDQVYVERSRANFVSPAAGAATAAHAPAVDPDEDKIFPVPVADSPVRGPSTALVTVIEFADYQCPFCKRAEDSMVRLRREYPADVRIVFKEQPLSFHIHAEPAAELALEARAEKGDAGYWTAHDKLYASQPALETADLLGIAVSMGLDQGRVSTAILTRKHHATIDADSKLATSFGANGTPTFFINGHKVTGAQPYDRFKSVVDGELPKARAKLASGTPRSRLYEALVGLP